MNRFNKTSFANRIKNALNVPLAVSVAILVLFVGAVLSMSNSSYFDERATLDNAIKKDIIHCYAIEGYYPPSVEYMEENYGLTYDHSRFIINYERIGDNVMPTYFIIDGGAK